MSWINYKLAYLSLFGLTHSIYIWYLTKTEDRLFKIITNGLMAIIFILMLELVIYLIYDYLRVNNLLSPKNKKFMLTTSLLLQPLNLALLTQIL